MNRVPTFRLAVLCTGSRQWRYWILRDDESPWTEASFDSYVSEREAIRAGCAAVEDLKQQWAAISGA
jgi:hypothetical protein